MTTVHAHVLHTLERHTSITLTLWENDIDKLQLENSYHLKRLIIRSYKDLR